MGFGEGDGGCPELNLNLNTVIKSRLMPMACKFCLEDKKCIKAHIIPNSLYKPILNDKSGLLILSNKSENYPKKQHTGIYDTNIICL